MQEDFTAFMADFGVQATWTPSAGGAVQIESVIFDAFEENQGFDAFRAAQKEIEITCPASKFIGLKKDEILVINATSYRVREISLIDDGNIKRVLLGEFQQ